MTARHTSKTFWRRRRHFTLIELIVVVGLAVLLATLAGRAMQNGSGDFQLRNAVRMVNAQLTRARSLAVQNRKDVELKWVKNDPGTEEELDDPYWVLSMEQDVANTKTEIEGTRLYCPGGIMVSDWTDVTFNRRGGTNATATIKLSTPKESKQKENEFDDDRYYEITVNQYTGRTATKFCESND